MQQGNSGHYAQSYQIKYEISNFYDVVAIVRALC
jgi:hypothetical protein